MMILDSGSLFWVHPVCISPILFYRTWKCELSQYICDVVEILQVSDLTPEEKNQIIKWHYKAVL